MGTCNKNGAITLMPKDSVNFSDLQYLLWLNIQFMRVAPSALPSPRDFKIRGITTGMTRNKNWQAYNAAYEL